MSRRSKLLTFGLPLLGLSALGSGAVLVAENQPSRPAEEPPRQPTQAPDLELPSGAAFIGAIGVSEPPGELIAIGVHTSGIVSEVNVHAGDRVAAGDVLLMVDRRRALALVEQRLAAIEVARAEVDSLRASIPPARAELASAQAALRSSNASVRVAEADLRDRENLLRIAESVDDPRAIATEEVDRRRFAREQAAARVEVAEAAVAEAEAAVQDAKAELARLVTGDEPGPNIRAANERVREAERAFDSSTTDLDLHTVVSPVDAVVLQVNVRPGEFASASRLDEGFVVLGRTGGTRLRVEIDEVDIPRFRTEARAWASPRGDASRRLDLGLAYIEPLVVPKTNLAGRTSELIDTRVLQVVYNLPDGFESPGIGQQFDVYIAVPNGSEQP